MKKRNDNHFDALKYSYRLIWSEEDGEFVGLCAEFPSCSWLAKTPEKALHGIRELVDGIIKDLAKNGEEIPEPISLKRFSGKFVVRLSPEVHRKLALEAQERRISLNLLINTKLAG